MLISVYRVAYPLFLDVSPSPFAVLQIGVLAQIFSTEATEQKDREFAKWLAGSAWGRETRTHLPSLRNFDAIRRRQLSSVY